MKSSTLNNIAVGFLAVVIGFLAVAGFYKNKDANVGATIPVSVATFQTSLQSSISSSDTSMTLVSGTDKAGNTLSGYICFNIDEGTSIEEFVCGSVSGTAVTSMIRGISPVDGDLEVTALKKAHRRGASVKVTNYPSLAIISRILNGNETIPNALSYASGVGPTASSDLADKEYVLSVVSGGAVSFEKVVISGNAGETVVAGNLLYLNTSDGEWYKADADTAANVENSILGIGQGAGTNGNAITGGILIKGIDENQSGLSSNTIYYASNTAGGLSSSAGTSEVTIGVALDATDLVFAPRYNQQLTEVQQDALVGDLTPSSTNVYKTKYSGKDAIKTKVAGATITGATLPVPVFQNNTDNEFYACDANDTAAMKFVGFAITNSTDGNSIDIQFSGIVSGFTGLDEGEKYYVQDAVGTIGNTIGTNEVLVGIAISETELLIQKGQRQAQGAGTASDSGDAGATYDVVVNSGFRLSALVVNWGADNTGNTPDTQSSGGCAWANGTGSCHGVASAGEWTASPVSITDTGFTLRFTQSVNSPINASFSYLAIGEI